MDCSPKHPGGVQVFKRDEARQRNSTALSAKEFGVGNGPLSGRLQESLRHIQSSVVMNRAILWVERAHFNDLHPSGIEQSANTLVAFLPLKGFDVVLFQYSIHRSCGSSVVMA